MLKFRRRAVFPFNRSHDNELSIFFLRRTEPQGVLSQTKESEMSPLVSQTLYSAFNIIPELFCGMLHVSVLTIPVTPNLVSDS